MNQVTESYQWYFPGGVIGLTVAAVLLTALLIWSYHHTLNRLTPAGRWGLIGLRTLCLGLLLYCLCAPRCVTETVAVTRQLPTVAVLIDESGSMRQPGYHGETRLQEAERIVQRLNDGARARCRFELYGFADKLRPVKDFKALETPADRKNDTALYRNIADFAGDLPGDRIQAVLWLTDGIDTMNGDKNQAVAALNASSVPQLFLPTVMKLPSTPQLELTHLECPGEVRPGALFSGLAMIRKNGRLPGNELVFRIRDRDSGQEVFRKELEAEGSARTDYTVKFTLSIPEEGVRHYEADLQTSGLRAGHGVWTVSAIPALEQKILLYQGRLTFDQAYLRRIFVEDKRAQLHVGFAADVLGPNNPSRIKIGRGFPTAAELKKYHIVILNAVSRHQITRTMAADLKQFLAHGGSLLFMIANNEAANEFAGSDLEKFLPVTFEDPDDSGSYDDATRNFLSKMQAYRRSGVTRNFRGESKVPPLQPFELTDDGRRSRIFTIAAAGTTGEGKIIVPQFQDCALVRSVKPGALLLAETSAFKKDGHGRPLLAIQNYGRGRAAVLCTDGMWYWKLSQPSADTSYEIFWQNLLLWLSATDNRKPGWQLNNYIFAAGQPAPLKFRLPPPSATAAAASTSSPPAPVFTAEKLPDGKKSVLNLTAGPENLLLGKLYGEPGVSYRLCAVRGDEPLAEAVVSFQGVEKRSETENLTPDLRTLSELARAAGGTLCSQNRNINWEELLPPVETRKVSVATDYLWHRSALFLLLLSALLAELVVRRVCKLV